MNRVATAVLAMLAALGSSSLDAGAGEARTVKATSAWVGQGQLIPTGSNWLYFVGSFRGTIFVENNEGELHAGKILCPGTVEVNVASGAQRGEGRCVITKNRTDQIFARWSCTGTHGVECKGAFELTSGTGKFSGIQGRGEIRVRTGLGEVSPAEGPELRETGVGLAEWPALTYTIP